MIKNKKYFTEIILIISFIFLLIPTTKLYAFSPPILVVNDNLKICRPFHYSSYNTNIPEGWHEYPRNYDNGFTGWKVYKFFCETIGYTYNDKYLETTAGQYATIARYLLNLIQFFSLFVLLIGIFYLFKYRNIPEKKKKGKKLLFIGLALFIIDVMVYAILTINVA
jgi:hypothetical protein